MSGIEKIAAERKRQAEQEDWTAEHDDEHTGGELALAAACYATPIKLYEMHTRFVNRVDFVDPWPWQAHYDKRYKYGGATGNVLPDPGDYSPAEQIDLLVKAGALIAAEIDRLERTEQAEGE